MSTCQDTRPNHSTDRVSVYLGRQSGPVILCGYHAYANTAGHRYVAEAVPADHAQGCPTGQNGAPDYN